MLTAGQRPNVPVFAAGGDAGRSASRGCRTNPPRRPASASRLASRRMGDDEAPAAVDASQDDADATAGRRRPASRRATRDPPRRRRRIRVAGRRRRRARPRRAAARRPGRRAGARTRPSPTSPSTPVALVLGAGLHPDGSPSTYLRRRLDAARSLYDRGTVQVILVSGDNGTVQHDEPDGDARLPRRPRRPGGPHRARLRRLRHPRLVRPRARRCSASTQAVVLTQDYHLPRALFSCAAAGIDVTGVGVSAASVHARAGRALAAAGGPRVVQGGVGRARRARPVYGGHETGVQDALGR